jgi:hypothetical protein
MWLKTFLKFFDKKWRVSNFPCLEGGLGDLWMCDASRFIWIGCNNGVINCDN